MFAVLTHVDDVKVGEICNPIKTWSIEKYSALTHSKLKIK